MSMQVINCPDLQRAHCFFFFFFPPGFIYLFIYLIYFWLCWVFVSVRGLSLVVASGGHSSSWCAGLSLSWPLLLRSTGSRRAGSVIVAHGPSCSAACGIFTDQGSNPCPLHWQADSQPLRHQGNPHCFSINRLCQTLPCLALDTCTLSSDIHSPFNPHVVHKLTLNLMCISKINIVPDKIKLSLEIWLSANGDGWKKGS